MSFRRLNVLLALLVLALVVPLVLIAVRGEQALPGQTPAEQKADRYVEITRAATAQTLAFLKIDYRDMEKVSKLVLAGATGQFAQQYRSSLPELIKATEAQRAEATGKVLEVGIGEADLDSASVFVAADSQVRNNTTKEKFETRRWRIQLDMVRRDGKWLTSKLQFVG